MKKTTFGILLTLVLGLFLSLPLQAENYRIGIMIGNNTGTYSKKPLRFAEEDAKNMAITLNQIGGFPDKNLFLFQGKNADTILEALKRIKKQARSMIKSPKDHLFLFVYFSGHSEDGFLELGHDQMAYGTFLKEIREIPSSLRLIIVDACESGALIRSKGGTTIPPLSLDLKSQDLPRGEILMSSSTEIQESLESDNLQGSIFTHYLISGLQGEADFNNDGHVSLTEVYSFASQKTSAHSSRYAKNQTPSFEMNINGSGDMSLTTLSESSLRSFDQYKKEVLNSRMLNRPISSKKPHRPGIIPEGEPLTLRVIETITSSNNHPGDEVKLEAAQDIYINNNLLVSAGAPAHGEIVTIKRKKGINDGAILIKLGYVQATSGQWVPLQGMISRGNTGALSNPSEMESTIANSVTTVIFLPFYPFFKGEEAVLSQDTLVGATVSRDFKVN